MPCGKKQDKKKKKKKKKKTEAIFVTNRIKTLKIVCIKKFYYKIK